MFFNSQKKIKKQITRRMRINKQMNKSLKDKTKFISLKNKRLLKNLTNNNKFKKFRRILTGKSKHVAKNGMIKTKLLKAVQIKIKNLQQMNSTGCNNKSNNKLKMRSNKKIKYMFPIL